MVVVVVVTKSIVFINFTSVIEILSQVAHVDEKYNRQTGQLHEDTRRREKKTEARLQWLNQVSK